MKQMKKLSHVTVKVFVFSMSMMILTKISRLVRSIKIARKEMSQYQLNGYQMVQQHILDLFPILFDLPFRLSINFTPILRHVFTKNFKIFKVRSTFPVELKPFINTPIDLTNIVMLFDLDY